MAYRDFKDLTRKTASDKVLRDKLFSIVKNPKYDGYRRGIAFMVYKFFDKKTSVSGVNNEIKEDQQLAKELQNQLLKNFKKAQFILDSKTISGVLI